MCGRYVSPDAASIEREFGLPRTGRAFPESFNVAPSLAIPVIRAVDGTLRVDLLRWGLVPFFAKGNIGRYSTINARVETIETSASYRGPWLRAQRCLVPAVGFYEWHVDADGSKQPYYIHPADQSLCAFAGLWDRSTGDDGAEILSCTIITVPANALLAQIHNSKRRMPAMLLREARSTWLSGSMEAARNALIPDPDSRLAAHRVSLRVNSPRNNDAQLIEPID